MRGCPAGGSLPRTMACELLTLTPSPSPTIGRGGQAAPAPPPKSTLTLALSPCRERGTRHPHQRCKGGAMQRVILVLDLGSSRLRCALVPLDGDSPPVEAAQAPYPVTNERAGTLTHGYNPRLLRMRLLRVLAQGAHAAGPGNVTADRRDGAAACNLLRGRPPRDGERRRQQGHPRRLPGRGDGRRPRSVHLPHDRPSALHALRAGQVRVVAGEQAPYGEAHRKDGGARRLGRAPTDRNARGDDAGARRVRAAGRDVRQASRSVAWRTRRAVGPAA